MATVMRMSRGGRKKAPFYHIVVADSRMPRDGRYIERLGYHNPFAQGQEEGFKIDTDRVTYWHSVGAQTSDALAKLFVKHNTGPESVRAEFTKRLDARKELKKDELEAKRKAEAEAKAAKEAEAKAAAEAEAAEAKAAEEAAAAEAKAAEAEATTEEAPAAEEEAKAADAS